MSRILFDIRFALRNLRRSPLFTLVAVVSLALGIGANTAIFTLMDQLMLRLLPVTRPEQLVMIWPNGPHMGNNNGTRKTSYPMYQDFQQKAQAFSDVFCQYGTPLSIGFGGQTERVDAELVSGNYYQALGVKPALGRVFSSVEDDQVYKGHPVVVLSYSYWVTRFASDPKVVGQKIQVNNYPMVIVGVSAPGFTGLDPSQSPQIRVPVQMKPLMTPGSDAMGDRRSQWVQTFARMKPGFTVDSAKASLQVLFSQVLNEEINQKELKDTSKYYRDRFLARKINVEAAGNGFSELRQSYSTALIVLMCMVGLVLLIACFNVANLLIARAIARQKEVAVRLAIGASRWQLLRQLLIESLLLSVTGGVAGLFLAVAIIRALLTFIPQNSAPLMLKADPDARVLAFNAALAVLTGLLFGLAPAVQALRVDLWNTLKDVVGAVTGGGGSVKLRKALVIAQVAFSFLLLAGAGLFVKTLANLKQTNAGFRDIGNLVTFQVDPALNGYSGPRLRTFYQQALLGVRSLPGVTSATTAGVSILSGSEWDSSMSVEGHQNKDGEDMQAFMNVVSPGYWQAMGEPLLEGRDFDERDTGTTFKVAIVNQKFATHFFGGKSALGRHIGFGGGPKTKLEIEIVGVARDALYEGPREGVHRQVFVADLQNSYPGGNTFYVRTSVDSSTMFAAMRRKIAEIDPAMPIYQMKTLQRQLDETLSTERLIAMLSAAFGVLATVLAAIGLYGVMAFVVARRTKEIGLRMALGAPQGAVVWMVMRETAILVGVGLALGVPAAWALSRYVATQLFGVQTTDVWTAAAALGIMALVAAGAGFLPARRASGIDPIQALHYE
ncbi:MAG TPA: ABC transporter permease [Candidatus Acidoferrales bacterium]|nr:ABC transporter permease [Candidatus Acidoferrales bacterium]